VELLRRHALQRSKRGHARVIHQHIQLPVLLLDLRERPCDLLGPEAQAMIPSGRISAALKLVVLLPGWKHT
jgi:hypothetical protein